MKKLLLVSLKDKNAQTPGKVYVVEEDSIGKFIAKHLTPNVIILIDSDYSFNFRACDGSVKIFYFFLVQLWNVVLF